jgi:uncharacterized ion transporter superfamily protein YfcC
MKKLNFPHPLILLVGFIFLAAILSYIIKAGEYDRTIDEATGREVVVSGSYHEVDPSPVGFFDTIVAIPRGMIEAADIIFLVFLIGGAFTVVDDTKALKNGVTWLTTNFQGKENLIIIIVSVCFAIGGALNNLQEEIIALVPVLLILTNSLGLKPMVAISMSAGSAFVGASFSPINPFQVGIAQKLAQLPLLSGGGFRLVFMFVAVSLWIFWTIRYAQKTKTEPVKKDASAPEMDLLQSDWRTPVILLMVVLTFAIMIIGILNWGWDFNEMSACFFVMGVAVGLLGKLGINGTAVSYVRGFKEMTFAALLIGFARSIFVVLEDGSIIDTIVYGLFTPISNMPSQLSAIGMMIAHAMLHVPVPSQSGQAVLTMPLLVPLSDLIGLARQVTILAYQYGSGLTDLITPTNGALMAILAAGGIKYDDWFKFLIKKYIILLGLGAVSILVAIALGLN